MINHKILLKTIIFAILLISIVNATSITYNKGDAPFFEYNNSSLIDEVTGFYVLQNQTIISGTIQDFNDENVDFDYLFYSRKGLPYADVNISEHLITKFKLSYSISDNVSAIGPFSFKLGEWVDYIDFEKPTGPINIYNEEIMLSFLEIPSSYNYVIDTSDNYLFLYVIGSPQTSTGSFELEIISLIFADATIEKINVDYSLSGDFWYIYFPKTQIIPKMIINCTDQNIQNLNFEYIQSEMPVIESIPIDENGNFVFENPILIVGESFYFPFDSYKAEIYNFNPPLLKEKTVELPFDRGSRFEGLAYFENDKILFEITSAKNVKIKYWISLIVAIIALWILIIKNENLIILTCIGIILGFFGNANYPLSIGSIIFIIMAILTLFVGKKRKISRL